MSPANFMGLKQKEKKENNGIQGLLIHCFLNNKTNNTFLSASYSMIFVGHIMLPFSCMGPLIFFNQAAHRRRKKCKREKTFPFLTFIYVFVRKEC